MADERPNSFVLNGRDLAITYDTTSLTGQPHLSCRYKGKTQTFMGEDIRRANTEIGQMVTVDLGYEPDRAKITLILIDTTHQP